MIYKIFEIFYFVFYFSIIIKRISLKNILLIAAENHQRVTSFLELSKKIKILLKTLMRMGGLFLEEILFLRF